MYPEFNKPQDNTINKRIGMHVGDRGWNVQITVEELNVLRFTV